MLSVDLAAAQKPLLQAQAAELMTCLLRGELSESQIESLLTTLHHRGASTEELAGFHAAIQQAGTPQSEFPGAKGQERQDREGS